MYRAVLKAAVQLGLFQQSATGHDKSGNGPIRDDEAEARRVPCGSIRKASRKHQPADKSLAGDKIKGAPRRNSIL